MTIAALAALALTPAAASAASVNGIEVLSVDASDAPRQVWHAKLHLPVSGSGDLVLAFPKWIPGNHGPTGQIGNLGSLHASIAGAPLAWARDLVDPYAFHLQIPDGTTAIDLGYDFFEGTANNADMTARLAVLDWNQVVLYPNDADIHDVRVAADVTLPAGWTEATALPLATQQRPFGTPGGTVAFAPATLATLVDSPCYMGAHERVVPLVDANGMTSEVDLFGESASDVDPTSAQIARWRALVAEADALYGYRHWQHYHFLVTLSDAEAGRGLEHHESSANGLEEHYLTDEDLYAGGADLLPHEYTHSWNGKYRRPAGLVTKNYQQPMVDDGLWVYEGMTQYWGIVLAQRSGLAPAGSFEQTLAGYYATLDAEPGRRTRPLLDTAIAQGLTRAAQSPAGRFARRGEDYYQEGALVWLDADTLIRTQTHGKKSLDDFARLFLGNGKNTPAMVVPYTRADLIAALNRIMPYDWASFFRTRIDEVALHPPLDGITRGGWRFTFSAARNDAQIRRERLSRGIDTTFSLGSAIGADGSVPFTIEGMPLALAGVVPGSRILAVNGKEFSPDRLRLALRAAQHSPDPLRLILDTQGVITRATLDYHGGERYPHLVRDPRLPDVLSAITAPKTKGNP